MKQKMKKFLNEIVGVCKKHNLSIAHQDYMGAFIIEEYKEDNITWLKEAVDETKSEQTEG